jgi:hypothetical protein
MQLVEPGALYPAKISLDISARPMAKIAVEMGHPN